MRRNLVFILVFATSILVSGCGYMWGPGGGPGNPPDDMPYDEGMMGDNNGMMDGNTGMTGDSGYNGDQSNREYGEEVGEEAGHEHEEVAPPPEDLAFDEESAKKTFLQNCARCHGNNLQGGGPYPSLQQVGLTHTKDGILYTIRSGPGNMPANLVTGEEAENLAKWLWTKR